MKQNKLMNVVCTFVVAVLVLTFQTDVCAKKVLIKYTHGTNTSDLQHITALKFKEKVEEYSGGRIAVKIFPAGQLGSEQKAVRDIQNGIVQATSLAINNVTPFSKSMGVFDLPYLFKNKEEFYKIINELREEINRKQITEAGLETIIWQEAGFRIMTNSVKPVETMDDLRGLKIRVPKNPLMIGAFRSWGADATPIAWDETFNALQQRVADGLENPYVTIYSGKFYEVQKYITDVHYKLWIGTTVVGHEWLQGLPADLRKAVIDAGRDAELYRKQLMVEEEFKSLELLKENGMIHCGTPKDEDVWMKNAMAIWPKFYNDIGGTGLLKEFLKTVGRQLPE